MTAALKTSAILEPFSALLLGFLGLGKRGRKELVENGLEVRVVVLGV